jgi:hypothetical protein
MDVAGGLSEPDEGMYHLIWANHVDWCSTLGEWAKYSDVAGDLSEPDDLM